LPLAPLGSLPDGSFPEGAVRRSGFWLEARALAAIALPGVYAWGATVAWPVLAARSASLVVRLAAAGALGALLLGLALARRRPLLGRAIGVLGFVGLSVAAWGALGSSLRLPQLDPVRSALGALGWGLFALGWGGYPGRTRLPEDDPHAVLAGRLPPRGRLPAATGPAFLALVLSAVALPLLAWRVERPGVALLAQAVALAGAVGLLGVGTRVLLLRPSSERRRVPRLGLGLCALWLALGVLLWLL
jgi:hypothetical protein